MIIAFIIMVTLPLLVSANIALWIFGVRPYIHRHGETCITAANWGWSIWADLTTAWEIGRREGSFPLCVKLLFAIQIIWAILALFALIVSISQ
jgi:hypothetical protein